MKPHRQWLLITLLAFLSSCATVGVKKIGPDEVAEIENLITANRYYPALKLSGRVSLKNFLSGNGWSGTDASVALVRPYSFRVSFHNRVGGTWFFAISNRDEIGLSVPSRGVREVWSRNRDGGSGTLKIGSLDISGDDFARFVHPGLEEQWVRDGGGRLSRGALTVTYPEVKYLIRFNGQMRVEVVEIKREKSKKLMVRYSYPDGDDTGLQRVGVRFGNMVQFDFSRIAQSESLPASLFEVPASLR